MHGPDYCRTGTSYLAASEPRRYCVAVDVEHAADLYGQGWTLRQLAAELGLTETTVSEQLRRTRVAMPRGAPPHPASTQLIVALRGQGLTRHRWRRRQCLHRRRVVHGAAVGDRYRCGGTAHPTQSGLERDNTPADRKSRKAARPCRAWPASRGARAHRADFSWTAHFQGQHGCTADICQLSIHGRIRHRQRPKDYAQAVGSAGDSS